MEITRRILKKFISPTGRFAEENSKRQFILSCSTLYERMGSSDSISIFNSMFKNLELVKSDYLHTIPKNIKMEYISVNDSAEDSHSVNE